MGRIYKLQPYATDNLDADLVQTRRDQTWRRRVDQGWFGRFADAIGRVLSLKKKEDGE